MNGLEASPLDERDISAQMDSNHQRKDLQSRLVPDRAHMSGQCSSRTNLFPGFNRTPLPVSQLFKKSSQRSLNPYLQVESLATCPR